MCMMQRRLNRFSFLLFFHFNIVDTVSYRPEIQIQIHIQIAFDKTIVLSFFIQSNASGGVWNVEIRKVQHFDSVFSFD